MIIYSRLIDSFFYLLINCETMQQAEVIVWIVYYIFFSTNKVVSKNPSMVYLLISVLFVNPQTQKNQQTSQQYMSDHPQIFTLNIFTFSFFYSLLCYLLNSHDVFLKQVSIIQILMLNKHLCIYYLRVLEWTVPWCLPSSIKLMICFFSEPIA